MYSSIQDYRVIVPSYVFAPLIMLLSLTISAEYSGICAPTSSIALICRRLKEEGVLGLVWTMKSQLIEMLIIFAEETKHIPSASYLAFVESFALRRGKLGILGQYLKIQVPQEGTPVTCPSKSNGRSKHIMMDGSVSSMRTHARLNLTCCRVPPQYLLDSKTD